MDTKHLSFYVGLWFTSSTFCKYQDIDTVRVVLDLSLSISFSLEQLYLNCGVCVLTFGLQTYN